MPFWTLRRKVVATVTLMVALTFGWAAVVVAVALTGAHDEARSADAIAVLGAAQYNGRPSPVFRARLDHAAALYQRGLAPVVLVTGGVGSGDTVSESEVGRRYLLKAGLPDGAVVGLPAAASTSASLKGVAQWFSGQENRRVLPVSDGFHMLRLRIIATPREERAANSQPARRHRQRIVQRAIVTGDSGKRGSVRVDCSGSPGYGPRGASPTRSSTTTWRSDGRREHRGASPPSSSRSCN